MTRGSKRKGSKSAKPGETQQQPRESERPAEEAVKRIATGDSLGLSEAPQREARPIDSRARELSPDLHREAASAVEVSARIELIHDWMLRGTYLKGRTDKALTKVWGVARSTVWGYSAHAVRLLRKELTERTREELLAELLARVSAIGQDALERTEEVVTVAGEVVEVRRPDHRTALRAVEATGELLGLKVQRHEHRVMAEQMTTEQIIEQLKAHGVQVALPATDTTGETIADKESEL
jgi:hypothetical protein